MEDFQYTTEEEIYLHKKRLIENTKLKSQIKVLLVFSLIALFLLFVLSCGTVRDTWECELDTHNKNQSHICKILRKSVNCKTTIAPPIKAEVLLRINNTIKASAYAFCGWDTAVSEIRICFIILCLISVYFGFRATNKSSKKMSEIFSYSAFFFAILLLITSIFDFISIIDSKTNNYNLCNLQDEFKLEANVDSEMMQCSYGPFYLTILFSVLSAVFLLSASKASQSWGKSISKHDF